MNMTDAQMRAIQKQIKRLTAYDGFYGKKFAGISSEDIRTQSDFEKLPFTWKGDLRDAYPLGLKAVPDKDIVRIHSSSGTTGMPVIIPYTAQDIQDWAEMFTRCFSIAGVTEHDRVHITPGYGLWTAGIGFQAGAERLGAMAIPMGPGNTEKQLQYMQDLKSTVLCATSSYALLLAEEICRRGIRDKIHLKKGIIGSERWGEKMRRRIKEELDISLYDIYGLTEIYGPGIGISCDYDCGIHYFDDFVYFEIVDPKTGAVLPDGETGELVITTLRKEGAPLIRYRTHDLTRILPGKCPCGRSYPRIAEILGRTDDMVKVKGVIIFPSQIESLLAKIPGASSEYSLTIAHENGRDTCTLCVEKEKGADTETLAKTIREQFKAKIGILITAEVLEMGALPRSEKKTKRIFDTRF